MTNNIIDVLETAVERKNNPTVAGLDPRLEYLPDSLKRLATGKESAVKAILEFNCRIIDGIKDVVPAVKIQSAFYEMYSHYGVWAMEKTAEYAKRNGLMTMADVKRNDIGATAEAYARAFLSDELYDFITVNPYPGYDGIKPFVDACEKNGKGIFVLARMSNPSAAQLQNLITENGEPLYIRVGELIKEWGARSIGKRGYGYVGAVVGATSPDEARALRKRFSSVFFLVPGYGAQGGSGKDAAAAFDDNGNGAIVNNSRGIIAAYLTDRYKGMTYDAAARAAALDMQADLVSALR